MKTTKKTAANRRANMRTGSGEYVPIRKDPKKADIRDKTVRSAVSFFERATSRPDVDAIMKDLAVE